MACTIQSRFMQVGIALAGMGSWRDRIGAEVGEVSS